MRLTLISRRLTGLVRIQWRLTEEVDRDPWMEYMLQDGLLFKNIKLCVPKCSMRENLIQEKHNRGMAGHFGSDKTFGQLGHFYFCPKDEV